MLVSDAQPVWQVFAAKFKKERKKESKKERKKSKTFAKLKQVLKWWKVQLFKVCKSVIRRQANQAKQVEQFATKQNEKEEVGDEEKMMKRTVRWKQKLGKKN